MLTFISSLCNGPKKCNIFFWLIVVLYYELLRTEYYKLSVFTMEAETMHYHGPLYCQKHARAAMLHHIFA